MKKITKKIAVGMIALLFLFGFAPNVSAASGYAFTVGSKYAAGDGDSTAAASQARNYLNTMGYTTRFLDKPTYYDMIASINSSRKWIQSDVLYFVGHTIDTGVALLWNYNGQGGDYLTGVKTGNPGSCNASPYNYWMCLGLGYYSLSNTELAVYQGCYSGKNTNGLANYSIGRGVKSAIGWTDTVPESGTLTWTSHFMDKLLAGQTVKQAMDYANNQNYSNANIKKAVLKGTPGQTINSGSMALKESKTSSEEESIVYNLNETIKIKDLDNNAKIDLIANLIKEKANKNFNVNDYVAEIVEVTDDVTYYDFNFKINGVKSSIGYVAQVNEEENIIVSIYDNMRGYSVSSLKMSKEAPVESKLNTLSESKIANMRTNAMDQGFKSSIFDRTLGNEYMYYDVKENKLYYIIDVEERFNGEISAVLDYWTEIK